MKWMSFFGSSASQNWNCTFFVVFWTIENAFAFRFSLSRICRNRPRTPSPVSSDGWFPISWIIKRFEVKALQKVICPQQPVIFPKSWEAKYAPPSAKTLILRWATPSAQPEWERISFFKAYKSALDLEIVIRAFFSNSVFLQRSSLTLDCGLWIVDWNLARLGSYHLLISLTLMRAWQSWGLPTPKSVWRPWTCIRYWHWQWQWRTKFRLF
jgi:hypothetical protein